MVIKIGTFMHIIDQTPSKQIKNPFSPDSLEEVHVLRIESHMSRKIQIAVRIGERARISGEFRRRRTTINGIMKIKKITAITTYATQGLFSKFYLYLSICSLH